MKKYLLLLIFFGFIINNSFACKSGHGIVFVDTGNSGRSIIAQLINTTTNSTGSIKNFGCPNYKITSGGTDPEPHKGVESGFSLMFSMKYDYDYDPNIFLHHKPQKVEDAIKQIGEHQVDYIFTMTYKNYFKVKANPHISIEVRNKVRMLSQCAFGDLFEVPDAWDGPQTTYNLTFNMINIMVKQMRDNLKMTGDLCVGPPYSLLDVLLSGESNQGELIPPHVLAK